MYSDYLKEILFNYFKSLQKSSVNRLRFLIFYNTDTENSATISRKDTKDLIDAWNEADSKCLTDIKCAERYKKRKTKPQIIVGFLLSKDFLFHRSKRWLFFR